MASLPRALAQYLLALHHYQLLAERHRSKIAGNPYFQPETAFQRIDKFRKGYLIPDDLAEFMLENQVYPSEAELYLIFRDFDSQRAGVVTLQQLSKQLLPKEDSELHQKAIQRKYYPPGPRLEIDLQYQIAKYFEHKLKEIKQLALIRAQLLKHSHMVEAAFGLLDYRKEGYLSSLHQLDQFLRANGKVMAQAELGRILRALSFDQGPYVTYECFRQQLDPFAKGYYIGYSQRIAEKHMIQRGYLREKIELNNSLVQTSKQRLMLSSEIAALRDSNQRLGRLIEMQGEEQRARQQQLFVYRLQRGEY